MTAQDTDADKKEMKNLLSRNVSVNIVSKIFYMFTRVGLPPVILSYVTLDEYGIWAACFILISYLGMSAFGVSNVYIRYVADYRARNETEKINRLISTGLTVTLALSLVLLVLLWLGLPAVIVLFKVPLPLQRTAFVLIFVTAATFMLDLTFGAFAYVLHGLQMIVQQTVVWVISFCMEAALIVLMLVGGFGIYALLWAFVIRYLFATVANIVLCYRAIPGLSLGIRLFDRASLRLFYGYGAIVQISGLLGMFLYSIEKVLAGTFVGVHATGLFDVGEKFPVMSSQISSSMNASFLPAVSHLHSQGRRDEIAKLYLKGARYMSMMTGVMMGFLAAFAGPLITAWIGPDETYRVAALILACFTLPFQMNVLTGPGSAFHRGVGKPARELVYPMMQLVLVGVTVGVGFLWWGKTVVVIAGAVAASMVMSALIYMIYTNRFQGIGQWRYAWQVLIPGIAPYLFGFALAWTARPWYAWAGADRIRLLGALSVSGVLYVALAGFFLYRVLCDWGEREYLKKQIVHTIGGFLKRRRTA